VCSRPENWAVNGDRHAEGPLDMYDAQDQEKDPIVRAILDVDATTRSVASGDLSDFTVGDLKEVVYRLSLARHELADRDAVLEMSIAPFVAELRKRQVTSMAISRLLRREGMPPNTAPVTRILDKWRKVVNAVRGMEEGQVVSLTEARLIQAARRAEQAAAARAADPTADPETRRSAQFAAGTIGSWFQRVLRRGPAASSVAIASGTALAAAEVGTTTAATTTGVALGVKLGSGVAAAAVVTSSLVVVAADPLPDKAPTPPVTQLAHKHTPDADDHRENPPTPVTRRTKHTNRPTAPAQTPTPTPETPAVALTEAVPQAAPVRPNAIPSHSLRPAGTPSPARTHRQRQVIASLAPTFEPRPTRHDPWLPPATHRPDPVPSEPEVTPGPQETAETGGESQADVTPAPDPAPLINRP